MTECKHYGPFLVQKSFYSEDDKNTPHVYLLHPSGGLVSGDKLVLNVQLQRGSKALLTTPGATKFYRTNGLYTSQEYIFNLSDDSILEWMPQGSIFYPKAKAKISTVFILGKGAKIILFDMLCFNYSPLNTYSLPEEVNMYLKINFPFSIGFRERLRLNYENYMSKFNGFKISAMLFAMPSNQDILNQVRKIITVINNNYQDSQVGGATLLDELLVVRLLGNDNRYLMRLLYDIWCFIRPVILGKEAVFPRIWLT